MEATVAELKNQLSEQQEQTENQSLSLQQLIEEKDTRRERIEDYDRRMQLIAAEQEAQRVKEREEERRRTERRAARAAAPAAAVAPVPGSAAARAEAWDRVMIDPEPAAAPAPAALPQRANRRRRASAPGALRRVIPEDTSDEEGAAASSPARDQEAMEASVRERAQAPVAAVHEESPDSGASGASRRPQRRRIAVSRR